MPAGTQETFLTKAEVLQSYQEHHGVWSFANDKSLVDLPRNGHPIQFDNLDGSRTTYETAGRHNGTAFYLRRSMPALNALIDVDIGAPTFTGVIRGQVREEFGVAFRYPMGDATGVFAFVADRNQLAFSRGHRLAVSLQRWNAITPLPDAPSDQERRAVEDFIARIGQPFSGESPELTEDDRVWIVDAFPVLDRLSSGMLSESEVPSAAWFLEARMSDPRVIPGAIGDAVALQMIKVAQTAEEREAAERFGALWPSRRAELLEVIVMEKRETPAPR